MAKEERVGGMELSNEDCVNAVGTETNGLVLTISNLWRANQSLKTSHNGVDKFQLFLPKVY